MSQAKKIYRILSLLSFGGYAWVVFSLSIPHAEDTVLCFFRQVTGIPCPSCGTTGSLLLILQGEFSNAFVINPLGYLAFCGLLILPVWILRDWLLKQESLYMVFCSGEKLLGNKLIYIPSVIIVIMLWAWNIHNML